MRLCYKYIPNTAEIRAGGSDFLQGVKRDYNLTVRTAYLTIAGAIFWMLGDKMSGVFRSGLRPSALSQFMTPISR